MRSFPAAHVVFLGFPREAPLQGVALRRTMSGREYPALLPLLCWWLSRAQGMLRPGTLDMWEALGPGNPGNMGPRPKNESNGVEMCGRGRIIELVWLILRFSTLPEYRAFFKDEVLENEVNLSDILFMVTIDLKNWCGVTTKPQAPSMWWLRFGISSEVSRFPRKTWIYDISSNFNPLSPNETIYTYIFIKYAKHLPSWTKLHPLIPWRIIPLRNWTSFPWWL